MLHPKKINRLTYVNKITNPHEELRSKIEDFLVESSAVYPAIGDWWKTRVIPGLKTGERLCQVIIANNEIAALSIIKYSRKSSKLCTLRVRENYRSTGFGQQLLREALEHILYKKSSSVHYSISEEVLSYCGNFFAPYGFSLRTWEKSKYVKGKDELIFSINSPELIRKLASTNLNESRNTPAVLLSVKPEYATLIESGHKRVEFRRKFSHNLDSKFVFFYVTAPVKEVRFVAQICHTIRSEPLELWYRFKDVAGVDYEAFCRYFDGASEGTAIVFSNLQNLLKPLRLDDLRKLRGGFVPPQSYRFLKNDDALYRELLPFELDKHGG